ncbi:glycerol-3-phosphate acyltransferase 2, mitochondrial [Pelodytes ibericus]
METQSPTKQQSAKFKISSRIFPLGPGMKIETISPFQGNYRPIVGQPCQSCTPKSLEHFFYKRHTQLAFRNALHITEEDTRFRGWLVRRLCCFLFVCERPADTDLPSDLSEKIFTHPSLQISVNQDLGTGNDSEDLCSLRSKSSSTCTVSIEVLRILGQIHKSLSPGLIRVTRWLLVKLLNSLFLNVQFHVGQMATVREASAACPGSPVVFLCTHSSWLDGLLLPFILFSQNLKVPRVAWDGTDCSPFVRGILQRLGAVFLPTDTGPLSEAVLSAFTGTLLAEGHSMIIFLEHPSYHSLSTVGCEWVRQVMRVLRSGEVSDILIVPVGISYDCRPEGCLPQREGLSLSGLWRLLLSALCPWVITFGCARVDFAQPFSLQEYIGSYHWRHLVPLPSLKTTLLPYILGLRRTMFDVDTLEREPGTGDDQEQAFVEGFILHSLKVAICSSAVMSSHIMAALLLHRYRVGVSLPRLLSDFPLLTEDILLHGFDVGFSGQRWDLVRHSLQILRRSVSLYYAPPSKIYVLSKRSEEALRTLSYHAASLLPVFMHEAIGACAVCALMSQLPFLGGSDILFTQMEILDKLLCLCYLLPRTILIQTPCLPPSLMCQDILDKLVHCGLLTTYEDPNAPPACDTGRTRFVDKLAWKSMDDMTDSDSDNMEEEPKRYYKVRRAGVNADYFVFLCHLLSPLLRTYERAALYLEDGGECEQDTETRYVDRLHVYLQQKAKEDGSFECAEYSWAAFAVRTFIDLGVFVCTPNSHGSTLQLSDTFQLQENRRTLLCFIQQFVFRL